MADLVALVVLALVAWAALELERRRLEAEELDRRFRAALAALSGPDVVVRRVFAQLGEAIAGAGAATSRMAAAFVRGLAPLAEAAARVDAERIPTACHCGWGPGTGEHRHVARMVAGAVPERVLIRAEDLGPLGTARVALYAEHVREQLRVVPDLHVVVAPWRLVAADVELDRTLPTWRGMPYVRGRAVARG